MSYKNHEKAAELDLSVHEIVNKYAASFWESDTAKRMQEVARHFGRTENVDSWFCRYLCNEVEVQREEWLKVYEALTYDYISLIYKAKP